MHTEMKLNNWNIKSATIWRWKIGSIPFFPPITEHVQYYYPEDHMPTPCVLIKLDHRSCLNGSFFSHIEHKKMNLIHYTTNSWYAEGQTKSDTNHNLVWLSRLEHKYKKDILAFWINIVKQMIIYVNSVYTNTAHRHTHQLNNCWDVNVLLCYCVSIKL